MKKFLLLPFLLFSICTMVNAQLSVFSDSYGAGATFSGFGGSINDVSIDNTVAYSGTSSIKAIVPSSSYTGGAFKAATPQNLSSYNAISFWVKADAAKTLNVTGISNNGTAATFQAEYINLPVSTTWTKYIIPIPASGKLTAEDGLFHFAEGSDEGPYTLWFDDIQYENSAAVGAFSPTIASQTLTPLVGGTFTPTGQTLSVLVNGAAQTIKVSLASFNFTSSDTNVATIVNGVGTAVGAGTATITGTLNGVAATGTITVNVAATNGPATAAPTPTRLAANVISLFSNAYTDVSGTNWNPNWGQSTQVSDIMLYTNSTKKYDNLNYQGIELLPAVNATGMEFLHFDIWTPNCTAFDVFLINPGPIEQAVTVNPTASGWNSFDIPLTSYNTIALNNIFQIKLVGTPFGTSLVYLDNLYFYKNPPSSVPLVAAPTPTRLASNVISVFSNAYTNVAGTDFNPNWGQSTAVSDVTIAGNDTKKYATLNYQGIVLGSAIDASAMEFVHFDIWTPTALTFDFFLISPGPQEKAFPTNPATGTWVGYDVPLSAFAPPVALNNIFQIKLVGTPSGGTVWLDNIYFYKEPAVSLTAKVYLEHVSISSGLMSESLPDLLSFPASDPYSATPLSTKFTHVMNGATQTTTSTVLTTNDNTPDDIVDWVFVELRSGTSGSSTVAYTQAALLQRDGDIVNAANGSTAVEFPNAPVADYFVTIRHRNHLGFRTSNKIAMTSSTPALNFTNGSIILYGTAPTKTVGSVEAMNAGDADSDGSLDSIDSGIWETENGSFNEYSDNSDYNLDASVDALDSALWELNNGKYQEID